jgi:coiled-coil domain-containing protein 130
MQGFNMGRYVPPDQEGKVSFNHASGKGHPLGSRASKLKTKGILTVRFECPFAVWCTTCQPEQIIAQGVRFNAEKKKVGNYHSTPIWGFRIKHNVCGGWIEIRTDPKNAEYVVVEGGRRRDYGGEKLLDGEVRIGGSGLTEEEKDRLEKDGSFAGLEKQVEEKKVGQAQNERIDELFRISRRDWSDPYERSQALRKGFRVGRQQRQQDERTGDALKEKFGIGVDILPSNEEDSQRTKLIDFGDVQTAVSKPLFEGPSPQSERPKTKIKETMTRRAAQKVAEQKQALQKNLTSNSRVTTDPFLTSDDKWRQRTKRKRAEKDDEAPESQKAHSVATTIPLVDYDSDFE